MNPRLKIGYMVSMFPRLSETFILNEVLELENLGCDLTIFTRKPAAAAPLHRDYANVTSRIICLALNRPQQWWGGLNDMFFCFWHWPRKYWQLLKKVMNKRKPAAWQKFFIACRLARRVCRFNINFLHAHFAADNAMIARQAAFLTGIEFSFTAHAKDIWVKSDPASLRRLLKDSRFAVTICDYNKEYLEGLLPSSPKVHLIYNGLDLSKFLPVSRPNNQNGLEILAVGRLVPKKGFLVLLEACRILASQGVEFKCRLVGEGDDFAPLKALAGEYSLQNSFFLEGPCSQEKLITDYLAKANILVMPCVIAANGDRDGIPTVILEALAMKIPVIASGVAGIPEVILNGKTGILVSSGSGNELADGITTLINDHKMASALANAGAVRVKDMFDRKQNIKKLVHLFSGEGA